MLYIAREQLEQKSSPLTIAIKRNKDCQLCGWPLRRVEQIEQSYAVFEIAQLNKVIPRQSPQIIACKVAQLLGETEEAVSLEPFVRFYGACVCGKLRSISVTAGATETATVASSMPFSGHCGNAEKTTTTSTSTAIAAACWNDIAHRVTTV